MLGKGLKEQFPLEKSEISKQRKVELFCLKDADKYYLR